MNKQETWLLRLLVGFTSLVVNTCMAASLYYVSPTSRTSPAEGEVFKIWVGRTDGVSAWWHVRTGASWIGMSPTQNAGAAYSDITVSENLSTESRQAVIQVYEWSYSYSGSERRDRYALQSGVTCTITQSGQNASVSCGRSQFAWDGGKDVFQVVVKDGVSWRATSNVSWIKFGLFRGLRKRFIVIL